jgi:hypothetical protein
MDVGSGGGTLIPRAAQREIGHVVGSSSAVITCGAVLWYNLLVMWRNSIESYPLFD